MKTRKIIIIMLLLLLMCSCDRKEPEGVVLNFLDEVDVYQDIKLNDLIIETNTELINQELNIDTKTIGEKHITVKYIFDNKEYEREIIVNIVDKEKPFVYSGASKTYILNSSPNFCEELIFGDNYDKDPKCEVVGELNTAIVGEYPLEIKITDQSKNEFIRNLLVKIIEKAEESTSKPKPRVEFQDVINNNQGDNTEFGIDVSSWQEDVDYHAVKETGATFVMIRLGFQSSSTRELKLDNYYEKNITSAKAAGLKVGVYLYTMSSSIMEAKDHANWLISKLNNIELDLPVVFDWEEFSRFRQYRLSLYDLNEMANTFIKTVEKAGYKGMLYSSKTYLENFWKNKYNYPVWLAHYTDKTNYEGDYIMWQLTNNGKISGVGGPVDINIMYKR